MEKIEEQNRVAVQIQAWHSQQRDTFSESYVKRKLQAYDRILQGFERASNLSPGETKSLEILRKITNRLEALVRPGKAEELLQRSKNPIAKFFEALLKTLRENRSKQQSAINAKQALIISLPVKERPQGKVKEMIPRHDEGLPKRRKLNQGTEDLLPDSPGSGRRPHR